jgi:hypothetical protein
MLTLSTLVDIIIHFMEHNCLQRLHCTLLDRNIRVSLFESSISDYGQILRIPQTTFYIRGAFAQIT